jgi:carboxyl-terminal processing protease
MLSTLFNFMKRNYKLLLATVALSVALFAFTNSSKPKGDPEKDKLLLNLIEYVIKNGHYDPKDIDDEFSKGVYKDYLNTIDADKKFFLQSDINEFSKYEFEIDDAIKNKDLTFFDLTYTRLIKRMDESKAYYKDILSKPFDYFKDENFNVDNEKLPYCKNLDEIKDKWRKQIKLSTLAALVDKVKDQEDKKNGIKSDDEKEKSKSESTKVAKELSNSKPKTFMQLEVETRESSKKQWDDYFSFMKDLDREDYFAFFVNAVSERFDPHTSYFAPDDKEKFDVSMSGKFYGIGARLQKKNDYTEISELISGGPAWREKELEAGDIILKVAQGSKEPEDVVGMRINDVVKRIKGPKGTEVRLTVKKQSDGTIKVIKIIRDEVELEETYAKSTIVKKDGKVFGIINLPKFYIDFENKENRDAAKDVALEVERLKKQGVQGIAIDLRDNGGGSLRTVVDIAGLFIKDGPVVQVKSVGKKQEVLSDSDSAVQWDGPLVLMINNFSASASEILAAAIQDYNRGIVIGSKQSYGKGTVQNVIDLNQFVRNSSVGDLGALKTTTQKFYRIDGGSTQLKGVSSDVVMPDRYSYIEIGERDMDNAMPWDKIDSAPYTPMTKSSNFDQAIANSKERIAASPQFKLIDENAKILSVRKDETEYSLNYTKFKLEEEKLNVEIKKFEVIAEYRNNLTFKSLPNELEQIAKDPIFKEKRERWHEQLAKDAYIEEALNVLSDLQTKEVVKTKLPYKNKKGKLIGQL